MRAIIISVQPVVRSKVSRAFLSVALGSFMRKVDCFSSYFSVLAKLSRIISG